MSDTRTGWKLVPIEPTQEMIEAGRMARMNIQGGYGGPGGWEAMLAAAPTPPASDLEGDETEWIKTCTAKISNAIGGGSELFLRHGEAFRLDIDFVCQRISEMRERHHNSMHRAIQAERALKEGSQP